MLETESLTGAASIWRVGDLCRAIAGLLDSGFNPVAVQGEITGFSRAASGHCYFSLKDEAGQLRCAMFRRAASLLDFNPKDGERVELRGRLAVYEPRGELQLIAESMSRVGQGVLFEQFLRLKAQLGSEGLFESSRKRELPPMPRGIGVVTSLAAAALHDVVSTLQRRAPHVPVVLAPASVQGSQAPAELVQSLLALYQSIRDGAGLDVILLVRGGGSMEDLWAFNDEQLVRTLAQSPVPVISGVGHETDFTLSDFVADVRAPTPTAAAELAVQPQATSLLELASFEKRLVQARTEQMDDQAQRLDNFVERLGRPSGLIHQQSLRLSASAQRLEMATLNFMRMQLKDFNLIETNFSTHVQTALTTLRQRLDRVALRLGLLDPSLVFRRGYAWVRDEHGTTVTNAQVLVPGQALQLQLAHGQAAVQVMAERNKEAP